MFENKQIERVWAVKNIRNSDKINDIHVIHFFKNLSDEKLEQLKKAEKRNFHFTSENKLEHVYIDVLENGIYFKLEGCQVGLNIYCNFDGEISRKPRKAKTIKEYHTTTY